MRNQAACRLHTVLCDLVPGGIRTEISASQATRILEQVRPSDAVIKARCELAGEFLAGLRHLDASCATPTRSWPQPSGPRAPA